MFLYSNEYKVLQGFINNVAKKHNVSKNKAKRLMVTAIGNNLEGFITWCEENGSFEGDIPIYDDDGNLVSNSEN